MPSRTPNQGFAPFGKHLPRAHSFFRFPDKFVISESFVPGGSQGYHRSTPSMSSFFPDLNSSFCQFLYVSIVRSALARGVYSALFDPAIGLHLPGDGE